MSDANEWNENLPTHCPAPVFSEISQRNGLWEISGEKKNLLSLPFIQLLQNDMRGVAEVVSCHFNCSVPRIQRAKGSLILIFRTNANPLTISEIYSVFFLLHNTHTFTSAHRNLTPRKTHSHFIWHHTQHLHTHTTHAQTHTGFRQVLLCLLFVFKHHSSVVCCSSLATCLAQE